MRSDVLWLGERRDLSPGMAELQCSRPQHLVSWTIGGAMMFGAPLLTRGGIVPALPERGNPSGQFLATCLWLFEFRQSRPRKECGQQRAGELCARL